MDLALKCYVCGGAISGAFVLTSEAEETDRPFAVHEDCSEQLHDDANTVAVHTLELP